MIGPFAALMLLLYGLLLAAALTVWAALTLTAKAHRAGDAPREREPKPGRAFSNDEVRGARRRARPVVQETAPEPAPAPRRPERPKGEDAFERFLRAGNDDRDR